MTSQLKVALDRKATWAIDVLAYFLHAIHGYLYNQALSDVRSTGADIR